MDKCKSKKQEIYGRVVVPAKSSCDSCTKYKDCCKIDGVPGFGTLCLVSSKEFQSEELNELAKRYEVLQEESAAMSKELTELRSKYEQQLNADMYMSEQINELKSKKSMLESSISHMEAELTLQRQKADDAILSLNKARNEVQRLQHQTIWQRIFNR